MTSSVDCNEGLNYGYEYSVLGKQARYTSGPTQMSDVKLHEYPRKYHIGFSLKKNLYLPVLERSNMSLAYKTLLGTTNLLGYLLLQP